MGLAAEGVVIKLLQTHFLNALPVAVDGDSPQQLMPGTAFVDRGTKPTGSPTYPLDVLAAFSSDRKKFLISVVNPTEEGHRLHAEDQRRQAAQSGQALSDCAAQFELNQ